MRLANIQPGGWGALIFIALACSVLPYPGVQTDEALFGATLYHPLLVRDNFRAFGYDVPAMSMTYLGALKGWLFAPIFALWPPSLWSIRLPMVLLGAGTVVLFGRLMDRLYGRVAAWVGVALLATDSTLVMATTFDWGPVAIQNFLALAMVWWLWRFAQEDRAWMLALAAFLAGLALWNKAVFAWTLLGGGAAVLLVFPAAVWRRVTVRNLLVAVLFFAGGASMLIRYNLRNGGETWRSTAHLSPAHLTGKGVYLQQALDGRALMGFILQADRPVRPSLVPYVLLAAALAALALRQPRLIFPGLAGVLIWLVMTATKEGGASAHHVALLYPLPHWLMAGVAAAIPGRRWPVLLLTLLLAADNARLMAVQADNGRRLGGAGDWSEAILPLAESVKRRQPEAIKMYDWGMQDNLILLTQRALPIHHLRPPFGEVGFRAIPRALWVGRVEERLPGVNEELKAAAKRYGYERVVLERIANRRGATVFELFEFRKPAN